MNTVSSRQTFSKDERLSSKKIITELNAKGKSLKVFPFRLAWIEMPLPTKFPAQLMIGVPKKNFKRAVDRNRIKRQIREAYRKNKTLIYKVLSLKEKQSALMLVYLDKEIRKSADMEGKIILTLQRFSEELVKTKPNNSGNPE